MSPLRPVPFLADNPSSSTPISRSKVDARQSSTTHKIPSNCLVIKLGGVTDLEQDKLIVDYLAKNALAVRKHPGAVQFQVSKEMLN